VEYEGQIELFPEGNDETSRELRTVVLCLDEKHINGINLWTRSPRGTPAMSEVFRQLGGNFPKYFYSTPTLEEATGNNLEWFYEKFIQPQPETCLVAEGSLGDLGE
jgi:hypothetical protein